MTQSRPHPRTTKGAAYLPFLTRQGINARSLWQLWEAHAALRDYRRPEVPVLAVWVEEFVAERSERLHRGEYRGIGHRPQAEQKTPLRDARGRFLKPWPSRDGKGRFVKKL